MFRWYCAVTRINDRFYWYNVHSGKLTDYFNPDCVFPTDTVLVIAKEMYPDTIWQLEYFDFAYYAGYHANSGGKW